VHERAANGLLVNVYSNAVPWGRNPRQSRASLTGEILGRRVGEANRGRRCSGAGGETDVGRVAMNWTLPSCSGPCDARFERGPLDCLAMERPSAIRTSAVARRRCRGLATRGCEEIDFTLRPRLSAQSGLRPQVRPTRPLSDVARPDRRAARPCYTGRAQSSVDTFAASCFELEPICRNAESRRPGASSLLIISKVGGERAPRLSRRGLRRRRRRNPQGRTPAEGSLPREDGAGGPQPGELACEDDMLATPS